MGRAWAAVAAGVAVNLCLGILYAWSVWKKALTAPKDVPAGTPMDGLNAGWAFLSNAEATWAYAVCGFTFALTMIPGGRLQDRRGPRAAATLGGLLLGGGCLLAGLLKSYAGLVVGFGLVGGVGMGLCYAAATPPAVRWFGPRRRGLVVGLVLSGFGAAAVYVAPLARWLIAEYGLTGSFVAFGGLFATVIVTAARVLRPPPPGYVPPAGPPAAGKPVAPPAPDRAAPEVLRTWQYPALVGVYFGAAQAGLLVIANAAAFPAGWLLVAVGAVVNAVGRVGTGTYSDRIGRNNAFAVNGLAAAGCLFALPGLVGGGGWPLFLAAGVVYWQYGGTLALMPAWTADLFGPKHLGLNYGLVFLGWGFAFFVPQLAGFIQDATGGMDAAFYLSGGLLLGAVAGSRVVKRPHG